MLKCFWIIEKNYIKRNEIVFGAVPSSNASPSLDTERLNSQNTEISSPPAEASSSLSKSKGAVILLLLLLTIAAAYSPALGGDFVWDDIGLIRDAPSVHRVLSMWEYFSRPFWTEEQGVNNASYFRPIVTLSYALDWHLWDGNPNGFHLFNIFIHLINCLLVFFLARKWGARFWPAAFSMALFGLLPRLSESVAWISGRTDSMASCFILLALLIYPVTPSSSCQDQSDLTLRTTGRCILTALFLFAGLCCKEVAAAGLAAITAIELMGLARRKTNTIKNALCRLVCLIPCVAAYAFLRLSANVHSVKGSESPDVLIRLKTILASLGEYARMTLMFPFPELQVGSRESPRLTMAIVGACIIVAAIIAVWKIGIRRLFQSKIFPWAVMGFSALLLVIHIFPLALRPLNADRFLYVPSIAFCITLALTLSRQQWTNRKKMLALALAGTALVLSFIQTYIQADRWGSERSVFSWGCRQATNNFQACILLAGCLARDGLPEDALRVLRYIGHREEADAPLYWQQRLRQTVLNIAALSHFYLGRHTAAIKMFQNIEENISKANNLENSIKLLSRALLITGEVERTRALSSELRKNLILDSRKLNSFDRSIQRVENLRRELGAFVSAAPRDLPNKELNLAVLLGNQLDDRFRLTQLYLEILHRQNFPAEAMNEAILYLEDKGICSQLNAAPNLTVVMPERCRPLPEELYN